MTNNLTLKLIYIIAIINVMINGCIYPNAIDPKITGINNELSSLRSLVSQQSEQINNNLTLWQKNVEAQNIDYGGVWIVIGIGIVVIIFVSAGLLIIKGFMKRGTLLTLLTCAVQKLDPLTQIAVKQQLKREVAKGKFTEYDRKDLGEFAKRRGTFAEHK